MPTIASISTAFDDTMQEIMITHSWGVDLPLNQYFIVFANLGWDGDPSP